MCIYGGYMCICVSNIEFLCPTLWLVEVCTDDNADIDGQSMIVKALFDKPNKPKSLPVTVLSFKTRTIQVESTLMTTVHALRNLNFT